MKKDNSKFIAIFLAAITIFIVTFSIFYKPEVKETDFNGSILSDASQFFTVNSCLYRMTTYIANNDKESLLKILDSNYKKKNKVTKENVLTVFPNVDENSSFKSKKMYYEEVSKDITKYYVYGSIIKEEIHDYTNVDNDEKDYYFIVYLDSKKQLFSIKPYDGKIFLDGEKNG